MTIWIVAQKFGKTTWTRTARHARDELFNLVQANPLSKIIYFDMEVPQEVEKTDEAIQAWLFDGQFDPFD